MSTTTGVRAVVLAVSVALLATSCSGSSGDSGSSRKNPYGLITPGTILSATSGEQPYFTEVTGSGAPKGFLIDLDREVTKRLGLKITYKQMTTASSIPGLTSGQVDMVTGGYGITPERKKAVNFSTPIYWDTIALLAKRGTSMKTFKDMAGKRIGVITGSIQVDYLKKFPAAKPVYFQGTNAAVSALNSGSIDGFVWSGGSMKPYADKFPKLKIAYAEPVDHGTAVMFSKKEAALGKAYDAQLKKMGEDGTFKKLYDKYFGGVAVPDQLVKFFPSLGK